MDAQALLPLPEVPVTPETLYAHYQKLSQSEDPAQRAVAAHWRSLLTILDLYPDDGVAEALLHATGEQLVFLGRRV